MASQNKDSLFEKRLSKKSNPQNKPYQIRDLINRAELEGQALSHIEIKQFGKNRKDHRAMLALLMLQAMHNGSDSFSASELREC